MQHLVDRYRLYCQHLWHTIPETKKSKNCAILQGKFNKLIDVKAPLGSCVFVDACSTAKQFSLTTQKADTDIISIDDNVESTKNNYEKLLRKFESDADEVLSLPTPKFMIKVIESNKDGEPVYQGQKLKYYSREIQFLNNHGAQIIKSILSCYTRRYCNLYSEFAIDNPISDGNIVLFDVCHVLNTTLWPQLNVMIPTRMKKFFQFNSLQLTAFLKHSSS